MRNLISAGGYKQHADEPLRIGINGAFQLLPDRWCHWNASADLRAYRADYTTKRSTVGFCCLTPLYLADIASEGWSGRAITWDSLPALRKVCTPSWSITGAIALADFLGATDICVYGWDMAIGKDSATEPSDYTDDRAMREKRELADLRRAIAGTITIVPTTEHNA